MPPNLSIPDHTIFRDSDVLESGHVPEQFNYREAQMKDLAFSLSPGLHGARPINAILRGLPGTGKTTSVKHIFAEVEETTKRILPVYVNCQNDKTLFAVLSRIHHQMFGHSPPALGCPGSHLLDKIGKTLMDRKVVLAVCLDDANYLLPGKLLNNILYTILRLYETYPGTKSGVMVTVSNIGTNFTQELDPCVMSVFQPMEIYFSPYSRDEVRGILQDRVHQALYPSAISDEILDLIVEKAMSCGDLRVGLDLVRRAAVSVDREGLMAVSSRHVESAFEFSQNVHLETTMKTLTDDELNLLTHIAHLTLEEPDIPLTAGSLYESAQMKMRLSYTLFHQRIKKFDEMRLININLKSKGNGGKTREIMLRYDPVKVMEACG
ncbi:MAG: ORC1-type DNA replication protein 2 [Methanoregulaceae archaeon PtaB.Bin056]|nr:MAG: ORC1-type DNA replication protein 2 [Methanoregulaceae archaeon PtaB.Bin056]